MQLFNQLYVFNSYAEKPYSTEWTIFLTHVFVLSTCYLRVTSVFALRNIHDIFLRKWPLVVFNISVACHDFKTTIRSYSVTRQMPSIAIFAPLISSVSSRELDKSSFRAPFYLGS